MIKKQNKIISILLIALSLVMISNVEAATIHYTGGNDTGITLVDDNDNPHAYKDPYFSVELNGSTYTGYCVDPGYAMSGSVEATCEPLSAKPAMSWLMQNLTGDHVVDQLAIRMVAIREDINKQVSLKGTGIVLYLQERLGGLPSTRLYGSDKVETAYNLHLQAMENAGNVSTEETSLNFFRSGGTGSTVTYNVTSNKYIDPSNLAFTCEGGCTINNKTWNGTSGTITVTAIPETSTPNSENCSFTINAYYPTSGTYICSANGVTFQNIIINANADMIVGGSISTTGEPTQKIPVKIDSSTGGDYYQNYCDGPDSCSQKTEVNIPEYCDDSTGEEITITAPTDVKNCILNGSDDAGNTYQSTAVSSSNPYCSVFCKEDYKMTLPGAQYTTSGKYFDLKNVIASGTRSCYVTGANGTDGINLTQYKKDIVDKQKKLVDAYNAYIKAKTIYDNKSKATSSTTKNCEETETYTKYTLASQSYTSYTYSCSESTGKCTLSTTTSSTGQVTWGKSANNTHGTDNQVSSTQLTGYSCTYNSVTKKYNCSKATCTSGTATDHGSEPTNPSTTDITTATNNLKAVIDNIESCYNWTNNYCFEPDVEFDYNEQYSADINFDKVAGSEKESSSVSVGTIIDNEYNTNNSGSITEDISYIGCSSTGCSATGNKAEDISSTVTYIKKVVNKSAEYNNKQQFQANYPHGTIDTVSDPNNVRNNYSYLGAVFPVALKTTKGVYNWTLNFENVGQYNDDSSCRLGRLNSVATAVGKTLENDIGYVCVYVVDCDDCDYGCECPTNLPDGYSCVKKSQFVCEIEVPEPKCPECEVYCVNCIFDGKDTYGYRTISLSDLNPNDRTMGANWTSDKGQTTKTEIEKNNEQVYKEPDYSYTMTATQMKNIRDYNKQKGTYVADDLTYHKLGNYNNVYGTSSFLDDGVAKGYFTENKRNTSWTLWTGTVNTEGSGPSWK